MKPLTSALALMATLAAPAYAGGLAPERSPRPPERPIVLGCDWPVYGRDGITILYWTGTACDPIPEDGPTASPRRGAATLPADGPAFTPPAAGPVGPVHPVEPVHPVKPAHPENPKGNASANNGKGGNYDHTGHTDNGKGRGKGRD